MSRQEQRKGSWIPASPREQRRGILKSYETTADLWILSQRAETYLVERIAAGGRHRGMRPFTSLEAAEHYILWDD